MVETNVEKWLTKRAIPTVSHEAAKSVSNYRKGVLEDEIAHGQIMEKGNTGYTGFLTTGKTVAGNVLGSRVKTASYSSGTTGASSGGWRGSGGTLQQLPEIYSPLWLTSNLNLPRDRATINAWSRAFFALNPIVQNAITLHSTYPISKLNITCKDPKVEQLFNEIIEEVDLINICSQIAQEYWVIGEAFPYAELDDSTGKWNRIILQNPDYIIVKHSVVAGEPILSLRPDENLKRIVTSNKPSDAQQRQRLHKSIVEHVKKGENIPLSNFYAHPILRKLNPYEIRGTGLITCCFRHLMLYDKLTEAKFVQADDLINPLTLVKIGGDKHFPEAADLEGWREVFECHDEETEVLTSQGFKKFHEVIEFKESLDGTYNYPIISYSSPKAGIKIACFNPDNEELEYHEPSAAHVYNYEGEMYHFHNDKMDIKVTPNHRMWVQRKRFKGNGPGRESYWAEWDLVEAEKMKFTNRRFRSVTNWKGNDEIKSVKVAGYDVPIELYLEFLGYVISEGCLYTNEKSQYTVGVSQTTTNKDGTVNEKYLKIKDCFDKFANAINKSYSEQIRPPTLKQQETWNGILAGRDLYLHFDSNIGTIEGNKAEHKIIPSWVKDLSPRLLKILLDALVVGDGHVATRKVSDDIVGNFYYTTSPKLADDVYEIVFKLGYAPNLLISDNDEYLYYLQKYGEISRPRKSLYRVLWSNSNVGEYPLANEYVVDPRTKEKTEIVSKTDYQGKVWCFTVPTGLFVTRRNGKITIQGNSAAHDKNFKIFTHGEVSVEPVGFGSAVMDTSADYERIRKELYMGLMMPQVLADGGGDVTYANGGVTLDVLKQRYLNFRSVLTHWIKKKIFAPIAQIHDIYEKKDGEKRLVIPEVEWNYMSLFDAGDHIQMLMTWRSQVEEGGMPSVSRHSIYRSLGLDAEEERRRVKMEAIEDAIYQKEKQALMAYPLSELKTLSPDDSIEEKPEAPLPGQDTGEGEGGLDFGLPGMASPGGEAPAGPPEGLPEGA